MRIARVLTRLNLGGPARQVLASDPLLMERGHAVRLLVGEPQAGEGDLFDAARARGLDVHRIPGLGRGLSPIGDLRAGRALRQALEEFQPDVVHTHASKAGALGRRAARAVPGAATVHTFPGHVLEGYFPEPVARVLRRVERRLAARTDRIVAVSHTTADDLVRLEVCAEERLAVIPPGIELEPFLELPPKRLAAREAGPLRTRIGASADSFVVGVIGRLAEVKQPRMALDAFVFLAARYPGLHLVFVGDGPEWLGLERAIGALDPQVAERAHLLGALEDVVGIYAELDAVLSSSRTEGLPVALIEAGASALPVVAPAVGGIPEIVAHERTGLLSSPGDGSDGLAFHLAKLMDDRREAGAMGERARVRVAARHGARVLADRLEELYTAVLEERRCAS